MMRTIERVRAEFLEMPGLRLTTAQGRRLWSVDEPTCRGVLDALADVGFLHLDEDGMYARTSDGYLPSPPPVTADDLACAACSDFPLLLTGGTSYARLSVACEIHEVRGLIGKAFISAGHGTSLKLDMPPGTVYFEEITRLSAAEQAAIGRWLEHRPRGVSLISATGVDVLEAVAMGRVDSTLFYRLNVMHIHLS